MLHLNKDFFYRDHCPGCSSHSNIELMSASYISPKIWDFIDIYYSKRVPKTIFEGQKFTLSKCKECGLIYQNLVLGDKLSFDLYENWIDKTLSLRKKVQAPLSVYKQYSNEIEFLVSLFPSKKPFELQVAEFGMGWGFWSRMATSYGLNVIGIELSTTRKTYANKYGINIVDGIKSIEPSSLDIVYSNQVFEHLNFPLECLQDISSVVKDGGYIYIQVPNNRGVEKRILGRSWFAKKDAIHPMEHVNAFDAKSLKIMGERCGLSVQMYNYISTSDNLASHLGKKAKSVFYRVFGGTQVLYKKNSSNVGI